jgi:acetyl esterase/lipase
MASLRTIDAAAISGTVVNTAPKPSRHGIACALLAAAGALLAGCSASGLVNALLPTGHYARHAALAYGDDARQRLDLYVPNDAASKPKAPVIVFFYGGRWQGGTRDDYRFIGEALTAEGFIAVIPDYRVYPQVVFPAFVDDGAAAVRWTIDHIADYGGDPDRIILMGHSAGAHLAMLLALDRSYLSSAGVAPGHIRGVVGLAGPYDFLPLTDPELKPVFGPEDRLAATQPINFVSATEPPLLLLHGLADTTVSPRNSEHLAAAARAKQAQATLIEYPDYGHVGILARLAAPFRAAFPVLKDIAAFVRAN